MKRKFALHPGTVISRNDGQEHFVSAWQLARLYKLSPSEWFIWDGDQQNGSWDDYIHLYPDYHGRYGRPYEAQASDSG
jgi:hypothetical protein